MNLSPRGNDRVAPAPRPLACMKEDDDLSELSAAIWSDTPPMTDDELRIAADIAWAAELGLDDPEWPVEADDDGPPDTDTVPQTVADCPSPGDAADVALRSLEAVSRERRRAAAEESRLIALILDEATAHPEPWVGPDPTLDLDAEDTRRRSAAAIRRDRLDMAERAAVAEIAVRLRISEQTVRIRADQARTLQARCPSTWATYVAGDTSERQASETARLAASLPDDDAAAWQAFDAGAADRARRLTPARFAVSARALRERVHGESLEERHRRAARDRGVWLTAELDGMATLTALLPADRAHVAMSRIDRAARHLASVPDEDRTLAQLRADAFAQMLTADAVAMGETQTVPPPETSRDAHRGNGDQPGVAPRRAAASIVVTVPALTLLGESDDPAVLDGYGPIDLDTARRLAGEATSWVRLLTHPMTGAPLALDRTTYRVTAALRRWLGVASPTCIFPGCGRSARACDIDHLTAWADGGRTDVDNLEPECRHHHRLRHETAWTPTRDAQTGVVTWRSPRGNETESDSPPF
ncbi:DUF222 domain-containing protein [Microbacterium sp. BWR-S6Y]|uniref:HNH endonuclease signature motif containing protein n=1 Tax=Microbacterium sp. BWR-S6Y TaxID=3232073 RepID=UPI00352999F5